MVRVAMTGTAAAEPAADGAGAQAPATVVPPGTRRGRPWNSSHRAHMEDCLIAARLAGVSQLRDECPGYGTATFKLKSEKAAGDREPVQAAERSFIERTASRKEKPTEEQKEARAAARRAKKARQKKNKAEKAAAAAASEAERADYPHAQLRENVEFVMEGLEGATQAARNPTGSNIQVAYSLPPEGGSGFGDPQSKPSRRPRRHQRATRPYSESGSNQEHGPAVPSGAAATELGPPERAKRSERSAAPPADDTARSRAPLL
ncbi:hypothetical protein EMIHUDRAFT_236992 [Emiliania huxleyi CCMP1516]|uniref:Uncharacterized protein n=2 Tax=Emiliania huxleyi TaxID=2903 RepID=A0A0D3JRP9_EMIH1|nr:hypothetical protein EMIHUDRAFT_236992 [Emiliania huxleyi CCMP1516]EOD26184.1 hypothetical protein EMIHUDRAFT_236992 [Emiliania huxleyi CCMP1516]|eukprot:XP_005778613.1 hypothetical protein EMIHUDRAFT_236992 [Emiliania huxleyi CCMP1516]